MRIMPPSILSAAFVSFLSLPAFAADDDSSFQGSASSSASVSAQSSSRSSRMGVGAESIARAMTGAAFVYDTGTWHAEAVLGWSIRKDAPDGFGLGGRFYYALKQGSLADLSIGGGIAYVTAQSGLGDADTFLIEAGLKLRAFIVPQVAISGTAGLALNLAGDDGTDSFDLGGSLLGGLGVVYFF